MLSSATCGRLSWAHLLQLTLLVLDLTSILLSFVAVPFLPTIKHHHAKNFQETMPVFSWFKHFIYMYHWNITRSNIYMYPQIFVWCISLTPYHYNLHNNMSPRSIPLHFSRMHPWHNTPLTSSSPHPPTPCNPRQLLSPSHALKHTLFHLSMVLTLIATLLLLLSLSPYSEALDAPYTDPKSKNCSAPLLRKEWYFLPFIPSLRGITNTKIPQARSQCFRADRVHFGNPLPYRAALGPQKASSRLAVALWWLPGRAHPTDGERTSEWSVSALASVLHGSMGRCIERILWVSGVATVSLYLISRQNHDVNEYVW